MELWNEDVRPTAKPILPATMSIPAIADTDCGQVITAAVAQSFRVMKACEGLPDTTQTKLQVEGLQCCLQTDVPRLIVWHSPHVQDLYQPAVD